MNRTTARQIAVQLVFSMEVNRISAEEAVQMFFDEDHYASLQSEDAVYDEMPDSAQLAYISSLLRLVEEHRTEIDELISHYSDSWKLERMTKSTLAVLRCAVCEISYMDDIPNSAAVNEAVEKKKKFDSPKAAAYINGILGSLLRERWEAFSGRGKISHDLGFHAAVHRQRTE